MMIWLNYALFGGAILGIFFAVILTEHWRIPVAASLLSTLLLITSLLAASVPVNDRPDPPFILYAAAGQFAWAGPMDRSPPRTYLWQVPNELQELLQEGALMVEEGQTDSDLEGTAEYFPYGEWQVSPLVPEGVGKE